MFGTEEIRKWVGKEDFREAKRVVRAQHIISCGRVAVPPNVPFDKYEILACVLKTTGLKPLTIKGSILKTGKINYIKCSCPAGQGMKCKHIVGVLIHCVSVGLENLPVLSCTDTPCAWREKAKSALQKYTPTPLENVTTFTIKPNEIVIPQNVQELMKQKVKNSLPKSAFTKHLLGRHQPINKIVQRNNATSTIQNISSFTLTDDVITSIHEIFRNQLSSSLQQWVKDLEEPILEPQCQKLFNNLRGDYISICKKTRKNFNNWIAARSNRITGTKCYEMFTYTNNSKANWHEKIKKTFTDRGQIKNEYVAHGLKYEDNARASFIKTKPGLKIVETGLVVSMKNPWAAYSRCCL